ncbi:MAG: glycoside hydrolase family 76 protein [Pirellulales bacterium]
MPMPLCNRVVWLLALLIMPADSAQPQDAQTQESVHAGRASEVTAHIQQTFYSPRSGFYRFSVDERRPAYMWGCGIMFSTLAGAARHEPDQYRPLLGQYFAALDRYWDDAVDIPGYEPLPTRGGGNDKYYDDNAWMVLTFLEAYEMTGEDRYLNRADETLKFVLSGEDDRLGGGIWWHEEHKDGTKNTCSCAPAAIGCLRLANFREGDEAQALIDRAERLVDWTVENLQTPEGLFDDRIVVETGEVKRGTLTYNSGLMIRAMLGLYRAKGDPARLEEAKRIAAACNRLVRRRTGVYRDPPRWSHLLVEADLELYRTTKEPYLLARAKANAEYVYDRWKNNPPDDLMANASVTRMLWLLADTETEVGREFWERSDELANLLQQTQ